MSSQKEMMRYLKKEYSETPSFFPEQGWYLSSDSNQYYSVFEDAIQAAYERARERKRHRESGYVVFFSHEEFSWLREALQADGGWYAALRFWSSAKALKVKKRVATAVVEGDVAVSFLESLHKVKDGELPIDELIKRYTDEMGPLEKLAEAGRRE